MNLAEIYLRRSTGDKLYGERNLRELARADALGPTRTLLATLAILGTPLPGDGDPIEVARLIAERETALVESIRDEIAANVGSQRIQNTSVVFVALGTPQAIAVRESDQSYAVGVDRTFMSFVNQVAAWALVAHRHRNPQLFINGLIDMVEVCYGTVLPPGFEKRSIGMRMSIADEDLRVLNALVVSCYRFVLLHELGHIHLGHLENSEPEASVSAMHDHQLEFDADKFALDHLLNSNGTILDAVMSRVAAEIILLIWAIKEAFAPSHGLAGASFNSHPPATSRAAQLARPFPVALPRYFQGAADIRDFLSLALSSDGFQASAEIYRTREYSRRQTSGDT